MSSTRLSRFQEKNTKKVLYLRLGASLVILFLLVKFGIPGLVSLSLWLGGLHHENTPLVKNQQQFIPPPLFSQTFSATNSATISLSGTAAALTTVKLYNNGNYIDMKQVGQDGNFTFTNVTLTDGDNSFQARSVGANNTESDSSDTLVITYTHTQPKLDITSPHDGDQFDKNTDSTTVVGITDPHDIVTINGYRAIVDTAGNFSYSYQLKSGDNQLKIVATDAAGNSTEKDMTVKSNK